jgi:hypothetical protein
VRSARLLVCGLAVTLCTAGVAGEPPGAREYALLKTLSPTAVAYLGEYKGPDENGHVGSHQGREWFEAGTQRGACRMLIGAVVRGDKAQADDAWRAVDVTFSHQLEDGGFVSNPKPGESSPVPLGDRVETAFFFLQELARAILIIEASPMADHFEARIAALRPKLRAAADFIQRGEDGIVWKVGHTANRLLIAAKAFGLCGLILQDDTLLTSSTRLVEEALKRRDAEGIFLERGGRDSSYVSTSLLMGQVLLLYLPHAELEKAMHVNMAWLRTRIDADGNVSAEGNTRTGVGTEKGRGGGTKKINTSEIAQALACYGAIHNDAEARALADKVAARRKAT